MLLKRECFAAFCRRNNCRTQPRFLRFSLRKCYQIVSQGRVQSTRNLTPLKCALFVFSLNETYTRCMCSTQPTLVMKSRLTHTRLTSYSVISSEMASYKPITRAKPGRFQSNSNPLCLRALRFSSKFGDVNLY